MLNRNPVTGFSITRLCGRRRCAGIITVLVDICVTLRSLSPANSAGARMAAVFDPADAPPQPARRPGQGRAELADAELLGRLRAIDEGLAGRLHAAAVECAAGLPQAA